MMINEMVKGAAIELEVKFKGKVINFQSKIAIIADYTILVNSIKINNKTIGFNDTCSINFLYKNNKQLYIWENVKATLVRYNNEIYHKIDLFGEGKPYNRRVAYRLFLGEDMTIYINTAEGSASLQVLVKDISETGIGFITKEELDISRTFRLKFKESNTIITLSGIIVRKEKLEQLDSYLYGCKFIENNNLLSKFIARKQGEQLKGKSPLYSPTIHRNAVMR